LFVDWLNYSYGLLCKGIREQKRNVTSFPFQTKKQKKKESEEKKRKGNRNDRNGTLKKGKLKTYK